MPNLLIMIIDDMPDHNLMLEEMLQGLGYKVVAAESGNSALNIFSKSDPDIIITDINMPEMDGEELMSRLRTHQYRGDIPVVAITAHQYDRTRFIQKGFDDFISKPFSMSDLNALMARVEQRIKLKTKEFPILRYTKDGGILDRE